MFGQQAEIDALLHVDGTDNILRPGAFPRPLVFLLGRRKYFLHRFEKALQEADKQCVLILIPRVDGTGRDACVLGDLVERSLLKAAGKKFFICGLCNAAVKRVIFTCHCPLLSHR